MAINLSFEDDGTNWWVDSIWTYDAEPGGSVRTIDYSGPLFTTPLGEAFTGDVTLTSDAGGIAGTLNFKNLYLLPDFSNK